MSKPTIFTEERYDIVLAAAAKDYLINRQCVCDSSTLESACFICEVKAAIKKAEGKE